MLDQMILRLKGSKKIKVKPVRTESCISFFYLNSRQAVKVKEKGKRSVRFMLTEGVKNKYTRRRTSDANKPFAFTLNTMLF